MPRMTKREAEAQAEAAYNPLALTELARSVESKLLSRSAIPMEQIAMFGGAGIYAIFYSGTDPLYAPIADTLTPIYVGKAVPAGSRTGRTSSNIVLPIRDRIMEHANSVRQAPSLALGDFSFRYLVTEEMFIGLAERVMINSLKPLWNRVVDGFGNHGQGGGRNEQVCSRWDTLHPGRPAPELLPPSPFSAEQIEEEVAAHFAAHPVVTAGTYLPEVTETDISESTDEEEDS
jgi:hypothetical protein